MALNSVSRLRVRQVLDDSVLTSGNFDIDFDTFLRVICKQNDSYYFETGPNFHLTCSPGDVVDKEEAGYPGFDQCVDSLRRWVQRVERNLEADALLYQDIDDFVTEAETYIEGLDDPKLPIPESERASWLEKLEALENECVRILNQQKKSEEDIARVKAEIDNLKGKIDTMPAGTWLRSVSGRARKFYTKAKNSPKVQAFMLWGAEKGAEKLLEQFTK